MASDNPAVVQISVQDRIYKYSLCDEIGRGSFGTVYKGIQENVVILTNFIYKSLIVHSLFHFTVVIYN